MSSDTNCNVATKTANSTPDSVTKKKLRELLKGVVAYVDVRLLKKDASDCVADEMIKLGATVVEYFVPEVTHLVFFEGYRRSYKTALRRKIHIVAPHWISDSKAKLCKQNEEKYLPAMPPPKEEIPFFRKRKFKPMVDEIVAGTYIKVEDRDANYFADMVLQSLNKRLKSRTGTPKNGSTPRTGGTGRRKARKCITDDFDASNSESIGQLIAESLKKFQEARKDDKYSIWVDSPATTVGDDDDKDGYIPLFERCKARLLAEHKLKPPSERSASGDVPKISEPMTSSPPEKAKQETEVLKAASSQIGDTNVSKESQKSLKRRASVEPRPNKRIKLDLTSASDKPTEKRGRGRPRKLQLVRAAPSESSSDSELGTSMISQPSDNSFQEISTNMNSSINNSTAEIIPSVQSLSLYQKIPRGRKSLVSSKVSNESTPICRNTSKGLHTPSTQPARRSNRLSMRVQISLDKFLVPKEQIAKESITSNVGIPSDPSTSGMGNPANSEEGSGEMSSENTFLSSTTCPEKLSATNLHQWEREFLVSTIGNIGGVEMVEEIEDGGTLVVSGNGRRTVKILFGVAFGCWIVGFDWVIESAKHGRWVDVKDFETTHFPAAIETRIERSRSDDINYSMNLFSSCGGIFVANGCEPSKKEVELLIKICKGRIVNNLRKADICVGEVLRRAARNVDVKWVLNSISGNGLLSMETYLLS